MRIPCMRSDFPPPRGSQMDTPKPGKPVEEVPLGQRLFDNMFLLLALGLLVMFVFFTGWGMYEIMSLPPATLP